MKSRLIKFVTVVIGFIAASFAQEINQNADTVYSIYPPYSGNIPLVNSIVFTNISSSDIYFRKVSEDTISNPKINLVNNITVYVVDSAATCNSYKTFAVSRGQTYSCLQKLSSGDTVKLQRFQICNCFLAKSAATLSTKANDTTLVQLDVYFSATADDSSFIVKKFVIKGLGGCCGSAIKNEENSMNNPINKEEKINYLINGRKTENKMLNNECFSK